MSDKSILKRMEDLVELLNKYADAYYKNDAPLVSDSEYDALYDELKLLESETGIVTDDSPSRRVGAAPVERFEQHTHIARLYSMDKVQSESELYSWAERISRLTSTSPEYALEYKFDGLTINLTYDGGRLVQAATRGNGMVGEAILPQVMTIRSIPLTIPYKGLLEVQGEGYMRLSVLDELNRAGNEILKNARNAAAGALRNLDPKITASRRLDCACYNVNYIDGLSFSDHREMLSFLSDNGLPVSPYIRYFTDIKDVANEIASINRSELDMLIDGMVIKLCAFSEREALGYTDRFPRWAIAYKFPAEETTTTVREIQWNVGRTGKLTPLAIVDPVILCGATISRATLNNYDDILRKRVEIGARVFIRRSNDVIPEILGSVSDEPSHEIMPSVCPECGTHLEQRGVHIYCPNSLSCKPQIVSRLSHFASGNAMDIETFSDETAALLFSKLGLTGIPMLYELTVQQLITLPLFGEKRATALINAIENSKTRPLEAFLFAIGIPHVGVKTARELAHRFGTLEAVRNATREELLSIPDIGDVMATDITEFFADERIAKDIDKLLALGVDPKQENTTLSNTLSGKTVVVTGKFDSMTRTEAEALITQHGGKPTSSVSKNTSFVLAGENPGSKLDKAGALGIPVLSETEFRKLIDIGEH